MIKFRIGHEYGFYLIGPHYCVCWFWNCNYLEHEALSRLSVMNRYILSAFVVQNNFCLVLVLVCGGESGFVTRCHKHSLALPEMPLLLFL